jgi:ATP-dependent DNA helicase PIF1
MTNTQNFQHIIKYKLPSSIQSYPKWHKSQLQDLLTVVEEFGMPHF